MTARVVQLDEVVDDSGHPHESDEAAAEAIRDHWAGIFAHKDPLTHRWDDLAKRIQSVPDDVVDDLEIILSSVRDDRSVRGVTFRAKSTNGGCISFYKF